MSLSAAPSSVAPTPAGLTLWQILRFFIPLAASWVLMTAETPSISAAVARLPNAERMIAALGIMMALAVTIESPVIMLLGTSTALARNRQAYQVLLRYTRDLCLSLTALTALIAFTPLFDIFLLRVMGIPTAIAEAVRPGLQIMLLWTAAIGWRRFKQGVLIRFGYTRYVGLGTGIRLVASVGTAVALAVWGGITGVETAAWALMAGVLVEALYAEWVSQRVISKHLPPEVEASEPPLTYSAVNRYHLPLAMTSLLVLLAQPVIGAALARTPNPERALAAWPLTFGVLLISRSLGLALPELVIAMLQNPANYPAMRRFTMALGTIAGVGLLLVVFTPLGQWYYTGFIGMPLSLAQDALPGVLAGLPVPVLMVWASWERGLLMTHKHTTPLSVAMGLHILTLATVLTMGVLLRLPGVPLAAAALSLAMLVEAFYLHSQSRGARQMSLAAAVG